MLTIYFLRHGQTEWNLVGKYQGTKDVSLSEEGRKQAEAAAGWFDDISVDAIYTSPLQRAYVTAEMLSERKHIPLQVEPDFSEICFGDWEGLTYDEIEAAFPGSIAKLYDRPDEWEIPHAEKFEDVRKRVMRGISKILETNCPETNKTVVIVSHGAAIRMMLCGLLDLPIRYSWHLSQSNANISCVHHYDSGENWLFLLNSVEHLKNRKNIPQDAKLLDGKTV